MSEREVGLVFAAGALLSLIGFLFTPSLLSFLPLKRMAQAIALFEIVVLFGLAFDPPLILTIICIVLLLALPSLLGYALDIFLERATQKEDDTGMARGLFITAASTAVVLSPIAIGFILGDTNFYWRMFAAAGASLIPFLALLTLKIKAKDIVTTKERLRLKDTFRCLTHSRDVVFGASAHLMLQLFFTWVAVYIPLYLHTSLGISWAELGWVFAIMVLPFVLLEFPIGYIADKWLGERELMIIGFIITAIATACIALFTDGIVSLLLIAILVGTRVGAAIIEITTETYFFKHVGSSDVNTISFFRMIRPTGSLIGPLIGSAALFFVSLQWLFVVLGGLMLLGLPFALLLRDTK